ncbi:hydrogenase nickel incorporation protein HypA/HybF [Paenibacillus sophorae]|uniref:Hydrogenase maturation factor HypA n=1 Tax=Paenibacillus sophorae TaxID=1333845 RepID=A0A1H8QYB8_9BACL|nr:hydrogenase maturation nickel metallochaperone HypA [Paenibacillus sophorae]QWU14872.1 hydrogenase maturation nickel metallochaperone HypA [Paenibacillus sophorae]SEO58844.1 hydrogenase nickel incorporation protein HypA/HybF [Paenibacillus sophorae]
MHEAAIVESALELILAKAEEHHLTKIKRITAKVGELSGALPEAMQFVFQNASQGTIAEGSDFIIEQVEATASCGSCDITFPIRYYHPVCPSCGGLNNQVLTGYELYIDTMEGD